MQKKILIDLLKHRLSHYQESDAQHQLMQKSKYLIQILKMSKLFKSKSIIKLAGNEHLSYSV